MSGEIAAALDALDQRKAAALDGLGKSPVGARVPAEQANLLFSGLDLDPEEVDKFREIAGLQGVKQVALLGNPVETFASLFLDGVAVGLLIAEARARRGLGREHTDWLPLPAPE